MSNKDCPKGQILRDGYKTKTGKKVKASCITAQSDSGEKTSVQVKKYLAKKSKLQREAADKFPQDKNLTCPKGQIKRSAYTTTVRKTTSDGKKVSTKKYIRSKCIPSVTGKSIKGKKDIVILEKGVLGKYGYDDVESLTKSQRHRALRKALKDIKPVSLFRRVMAIAILNKNRDPDLYKKFKDDAEWIKTQPAYINRNIKKLSKKTSKKSSKKTSKK